MWASFGAKLGEAALKGIVTLALAKGSTMIVDSLKRHVHVSVQIVK